MDGERVSLFADRSRQLQFADPDSRDLVISCGAALQHLQVAAAAAGWKAQVRRMPNPKNDNKLANVSFKPEQQTSEALTALDAHCATVGRPAAAVAPRPGQCHVNAWTLCSPWARPRA